MKNTLGTTNTNTGTVKGICYNPTWTSWQPGSSNSGPDAQFSDSDFFNDAFTALWNTGTDSSSNKYRDDLKTISDGGFNFLRLYNWDPTRGWNGTYGNEHINFLNYAHTLGLQVVVPISNYFLSDDTYAWNGQNPDASYSFGSAPQAIQSALTNFLSSVTANGTILPAVHSFSVGNEIDINTLAGQGSSGSVEPSNRLSRIIWWMVNLQDQITTGSLGTVMLTSPISNADQGVPASGTSPLSYWFQAFVNGVTGGTTNLPNGTTGGSGTTFVNTVSGIGSYSWFADWYYNSVNIYQYGSGLSTTLGQYDSWSVTTVNNTDWPGQQFNVPLLLTEIGYARTDNSANGQQNQYAMVTQNIAQTIQTYLSDTTDSLLMGYCLYEFNDEVYLGSAQQFGIFMVETTANPNGNVLYSEATGTTVVSYGTFDTVNYPVDELFPVMSTANVSLIDALKAIPLTLTVGAMADIEA